MLTGKILRELHRILHADVLKLNRQKSRKRRFSDGSSAAQSRLELLETRTLMTVVIPTDTVASPSSAISTSLVPGESTSGSLVTSINVITTKNAVVVGDSVAFYMVLGGTTSISATALSPAPTGTIALYDGTTQLASLPVTLPADRFETSALGAGTHAIRATYSGDANYAPETSTIVNLQVSPITTTIGVSVPGTAVVGQPVILAAGVTATPARPIEGTITFFDGTTSIGTAAVTTSNVVQLTDSALSVGTHSITASFTSSSPNATHSTSTPKTIVITGDGSGHGTGTGTLVTSVNLIAPKTSVTVGDSVPFYIVLGGTTSSSATALNPVPSGTVTLMDGTTILATMPVTLPANRFETSALAPGTHSLSVTYSGDANYAPESSAVTTLQVGLVATTVGVSAPQTAVVGQPVTLGAGVVATPARLLNGTVTFFDGTTSIGTGNLASLPDTTVTAYQMTDSALSVGTHSITASFNSADPSVQSSTSLAKTLVITDSGAAATTTSLDIAPSSVNYGDGVVLTSSVTSATPGTPSGYVVFRDGTVFIGAALLDSGVATFDTGAPIPVDPGTTASVPPPPTIFPPVRQRFDAGTHHITATYVGDSAYVTSAGSADLTVTPLATQTVVASVDSSINANQLIKLKATVTGSTRVTPYGVVTFFDGTTSLGTGVLDATGVTGLDTSSLSSGTHSITAVFNGNHNLLTSTSDPLTLTIGSVGSSASSTTLSVSTDTIVFGDSVTFIAAVASNTTGAPSGSVTFSDGDHVLATVPLTSAGQASYTSSILTKPLGIGTNTITATYNGDATFAVSSATASVTVNPLAASTSISVSSTSIALGATVTLSASVDTPSGGTPPSGPVTFFDGATPLGSADVGPAGIASLDLSTLPAGIHGIHAKYEGDSSNPPSESQTVNLTVTPSGTSTSATAINVGPDSAPAGSIITFASKVTGSSTGTVDPIVPSGSVTFMAGDKIIATVPVDAKGYAVFTTSNAPIGTYKVTAVYSGDSNYASSSSVVATLNVGTQQQRYVAKLYQDLLGRAVDQVGLAVWATALASGQTYAQVAAAITSSREYQGQIVEGYYEKYLGRHAETAGLTAWVNQMQTGLNGQIILAGILGSQEYFDRTGGANGAYLGALYETFLGRVPDSAGQKAWLVLLADPSKRGDVASMISNSDETRADAATSFYQTYLHRTPDSAGLEAWKSQLANGISQPQIVSFFVSSLEYLAQNDIET